MDIVCKERSLSENDCLNNNTVNTDLVDAYPNDDNLLFEIDLQNLSEVSVIERYESANTKQQSDNKTVITTMLPAGQFSMFENALIGNVTINIYGDSEALVGK